MMSDLQTSDSYELDYFNKSKKFTKQFWFELVKCLETLLILQLPPTLNHEYIFRKITVTYDWRYSNRVGYTKSYSQNLAVFSIVTEGTVGDKLAL